MVTSQASIGFSSASNEILIGLKDDSRGGNPNYWSRKIDRVHSFGQRQVVCAAMDSDNTGESERALHVHMASLSDHRTSLSQPLSL